MAGTYEQFCAVAAALDVVGDRWTLLVVRELLDGPRRYGRLVQDLPGIATNLLATRLRALEAAGLVAQERAADGRSRTYRLTEEGQRLRPVVEALGRFGLALLPDDATGLAFRPHWLALAVGLLLRPGAVDGALVVRFDVPDDDDGEDGDGAGGTTAVRLRLDGSGAHVDDGRDEPDVVVTGDPAALLAAVRDPALARELAGAGRLAVSGDRDARRRLSAALGAEG